MPDELREYEERVRLGPAEWLGQAVAYRVAEACRIEHSDLRDKLKAADLEAFLPKVPRDEDVFRRVASGHQRKRVPTAVAGVFENYLIRDVTRGGGKCTKHIVVEVVDGANKRLDYAPTVELDFDGRHVNIDVILAPHHGFDPTQAENLAALVAADYETDRGHLNSYAIRGMLRNILEDCKSVPFLTGGGLYFVGPVWTNRLLAVEGLDVPGMEMHTFPIIDDRKQREMLRRSIESETNDAMDTLLKEIEEIESGPEITVAAYGQLNDRRQAILAKAKDYAEMLEEGLGNTEFRIDMVSKKLKQLFLNNVKPE